MRYCVLAFAIWIWPMLAHGEEPTTASAEHLPKPRLDGGRPLMEVLHERKSTREFSTQPVERQQLAELLWAAFGVNRPETGQRTAPCTMNLRTIDVYVVTADGAYRYDAAAHALVIACREDIRRLTGGQEYVKTAPLALLYVADQTRMAKVAPAERDFYAAADAGFIGQNVYLYCASESLGCVVHMPGDRAALADKLGLSSDQKIVLAHTVGHASK
jgi:nitroreductase